MTIFERIAQTSTSLTQFDDWAVETLAYKSLLTTESEWLEMFTIRCLGWNKQLISDGDYATLHELLKNSPIEFNKQPVAIRMTVRKLIDETRTILNHSEQRNNNVR